ncbi:MAG: HEPN domain-containing protein, partial [Candidatus Sumerlaeota bacterium]|nr:HEPN domain-containing protein [Candidatus Sumerlaeota bacterium]
AAAFLHFSQSGKARRHTSMNPQDLAAILSLRMEQAQEGLDDARALLRENKGARAAVNRAYYAAYYATLAMLQTKEITPKKHQGAITFFDMEFVKTSLLPKNCSLWLHTLFENRLEDDYERIEPIPIEEALRAIDLAEQFVSQIMQYLIQKGLINPISEK